LILNILNKFEEISNINEHIFSTQQIILDEKTLNCLITKLDGKIINGINDKTQILQQLFNKSLFLNINFASLKYLAQLFDSDLLLYLDEEDGF